MKTARIALPLVLLICLICAPLAANNAGPSSNGDFSFTLEDGGSRIVEFNAKQNPDGTARGEMTYSDPTQITNSEESGDTTALGLLVKAKIDCLEIKENKAVMSGEVTESSVGDYLGNRILLVVEDNGEGVKAGDRDKLAWGVYRRITRNWVPVDAENPLDIGATLTWLATDAEREDDTPIPGRPDENIGCRSFSLSSYSFEAIKHGNGNIQVKP